MASMDAWDVRQLAHWCASQMGREGGRDLFILIRDYMDQSDDSDNELAEGWAVIRRRAEARRDGYRSAL